MLIYKDIRREIIAFKLLTIFHIAINRLMICFDIITEIYSVVDEFCKNFEEQTSHFLLGNKSKRPPKMNTSEVITITLLFQLSGFSYLYTLLSVLCIEIYVIGVSCDCFLRSLCGTSTKLSDTSGHLCKKLLFGEMHRN